MELLLLFAFIIIIIMLLNVQGRLRSNKDEIKKELSFLKNQFKELQQELDGYKMQPAAAAQPLPETGKDAADKKALDEYREKIAALETLRREREEKKTAAAQQPPVVSVHVKEPAQAAVPKPVPVKPAAPKESWLQQWLKNNPDIEKFIGENLFNKIGIAVLVFGIAFFVKYAIDKNWINEYGRVAIGMGCGMILTAVAHYLRRNYRSFSSVMAGGGIAVFYFTIALAFHQYHIVSKQAAFILMTVITAFAVLLAVLYNRVELAVIAAAGGFLTPFMVSNGSGNYVALFSYLVILNAGLLVLSWFKKWPLINILALFFTIIIYGSWMINVLLITGNELPYKNALLFAAVFYILFLAMNTLYNIRRMQQFKAWDFTILLLINASFYAAGMVIFAHWNSGQYSGLFTISMGFVNFILAFYFFKLRNADKNLLYLLIGLTLSFLSLTAPVQLHGHSITLFWCAEMVLLLWLHQRSGIGLFKLSSVLISVLTLISLLMDWEKASHYNSVMALLFTDIKGIVTNITAVAAFGLYAYLLKKKEEVFFAGLSNKTAGYIYFSAALALAYLTACFGINLFFVKESSYIIPNVYHRIVTYITALFLLYFAARRPIKMAWLYLLPLAGGMLYFICSTALINALRVQVVQTGNGYVHLLFHWVSVVLLLLLVFNTIKIARRQLQQNAAGLSWVFSIISLVVLSFECLQLYTVLFKQAAASEVLEQQYMRAGLTILWGMCSFALMWLGMKHRYKTLRIISISLFAVALVKLFLSDIIDIGPGGKIAAFILLGVLLLVVSFMYQRLKKILLDDKKEA